MILPRPTHPRKKVPLVKATFMYGPGDVRVETVLDPTIQQPTDAIVRVARACVWFRPASVPFDARRRHRRAHMGRVQPGKTVTVIGDGTVGLSAVLAAKQLGAERIILMGRHRARTDLGIEFGATDVVAARGDEGIAQVLELTGGEGSHIVLEAVGHMPAYVQSYGVVRPGGVISRVGVPQYEDAPVGFGSLFGKNITLTGGPAPVRAYLEEAIQQVLDGTINPGKVFDRTIGIDDIAAGYAAMDAREALKVMVTP